MEATTRKRRLILISLMQHFAALFSVFMQFHGLMYLYMLYRKRNIDLVVAHFARKRNLFLRKCKDLKLRWLRCKQRSTWFNNGRTDSVSRAGLASAITWKIFSPVSWDPSNAIPGSRLTGLKIFHVIAKLNFRVFSRCVKIPANRASPAHVIRPLVYIVSYAIQFIGPQTVLSCIMIIIRFGVTLCFLNSNTRDTYFKFCIIAFSTSIHWVEFHIS